MMEYLRYIVIPIVTLIIGVYAKTLWDYAKLKIIRRTEIEKMSISTYFEYAKNHYFGIYFFIDYLKDKITSIHKQEKVDETLMIEAFYYFAQYQREISKFIASSGAVWFLTELEIEDAVVNLQKQIIDLLPFNAIQRSYLGHIASEDGYKPMPIHKFKEVVAKDTKTNEHYLTFKEWARCECDKGDCELFRFEKTLDQFSIYLGGDLNSAFRDWYKLKRPQEPWYRRWFRRKEKKEAVDPET